ncbi:MAG: type II toxin-antitoxin system RelE family toxin [Thermoguttaceae bacterium]
MAKVSFELEAAEQYARLPARIKSRIIAIIERLEHWPNVSGAKPLRGKLVGRYRMRTGDYRVQIYVKGEEVFIERVGHRDRFYEE